MSTDIIVRFTDSYEQKVGDIKKIVGLMTPNPLSKLSTLSISMPTPAIPVWAQ